MKRRVIFCLLATVLFVVIITIVWFSSQEKIESTNDFTIETIAVSSSQATLSATQNANTDVKNDIISTEYVTQNQNENTKEPDDFKRSEYIVETQAPTYSNDEINSMKWKAFTLTIDDIDFILPCKTTEFEKIGYKMSKDFASQNVNYGNINNPQFVNEKNFFTGYVVNNSDVVLKCSECEIYGIEIELSSFSDNLTIQIGDFTLSENTSSNVLKSVFGAPSNETTMPDGVQILYYENTYNDEIFWAFSFVDNKLSSIILQGDSNV